MTAGSTPLLRINARVLRDVPQAGLPDDQNQRQDKYRDRQKHNRFSLKITAAKPG
ncbi:hypothetical protein ITX54_14265 [Rouxiella silvae]|uniref:Uncharacterized protein n=1 Tax=Rouxiella silvae TaxID=1646373 RepID=A0AA40X3E9_9GAMM|nr:hypothetical protein [Rouxiella silvae]MBF6637825.1 hypothetical protein [Rouxiella silvae]